MSLIVSSFLTNKIVINYNLFEKFLFTYGAFLLMHVFISFNNNHKHKYEFNFEILSMLVEVWLMDWLTHWNWIIFNVQNSIAKQLYIDNFFEYIANIYLWILEFKFCNGKKKHITYIFSFSYLWVLQWKKIPTKNDWTILWAITSLPICLQWFSWTIWVVFKPAKLQT
jgi:hypothetical protein